MMEKKCCKCGIVKPFEAFNNKQNTKDKKRTRCKQCESEEQRLRKQQALEQDYLGTRLKERQANLKRMFKMSLEEYEDKAKQQNGLCAICNGVCKSGKRLAVDHDHKTGMIRDLLCGNCNGGLGKFQDSIDLLLKAAEYLKKHK